MQLYLVRRQRTLPRTREKMRSMAVVFRRTSSRPLSRHILTKPLPSSSHARGCADLGVPPPKLANALKAACSSSSVPKSHAACSPKVLDALLLRRGANLFKHPPSGTLWLDVMPAGLIAKSIQPESTGGVTRAKCVHSADTCKRNRTIEEWMQWLARQHMAAWAAGHPGCLTGGLSPARADSGVVGNPLRCLRPVTEPLVMLCGDVTPQHVLEESRALRVRHKSHDPAN